MDDDPGTARAMTTRSSVGAGDVDDIFAIGSSASEGPALTGKVVLPADRGEGMQVRSQFVYQEGRCFQQVTIENMGNAPMSGFALQYNKNSFGLMPETPVALGQVLPPSIPPGGNAMGLMPLSSGCAPVDSKGVVQMAIKNNFKVFYFQDIFDILLFLVQDGRLERPVFLEQWKSIGTEHRVDVTGLRPSAENVDTVCPKFEACSVFFIARRKLPDGADMVYFSTKTMTGVTMLAEIGFRPGTGTCSVVVKAQQTQFVALLSESLQKLVRS